VSRRVAYLLEFPTLSGGERSLLALLRRLDRREFEPLVFAPAEGQVASALAAGGIPHRPFELRCDGRRLPFDQGLAKLRQSLDACQASLLHANSLSSGEYSGSLRAAGSPIPSLCHVRDIQKLKRSRASRLSGNDRIICVSEATHQHLLSQGIPPERSLSIWNGIEPDFGAEAEPARLWPGDEGSAPVLLNIGQICLRKAQGLLLDACLPLLVERPLLHLAIVGERFSQKDESRRFEEALHQRVAEAGLEARVHFTGYRHDVPAILKRATLLVHSAHQEPLGRVLIEAQTLGVPVVATAVGGSPEIITHEETGLLVPPRSSGELQAAIEALLAEPERRARMGAAARSQARLHFDPELSAQRVMELYRELLGS